MFPIGYVAIRFCLGISYTGLLSTSSYKSEIFPAKWRFVAVNLDFSFVYGAMMAPGLSYLVPNWRHFCVMVSRWSWKADGRIYKEQFYLIYPLQYTVQ